MGNILSSLLSSAGALRAFERALSVTQNNVANASTPGYAKQRLSLLAKPFAAEGGVSGGVDPGPLLSSRNSYAELTVRRSVEYAGFAQQREAVLSQLEPVFQIGENAGLAAAFNRFFQSFSALAVSPSDPAAREIVIARAGTVAESFQVTARGLAEASRLARHGVEDVVSHINKIGETLRDLNLARRRGAEARTDPSIDAAYATALEQLSELADYTALEQPDGTYTVFLGGEKPLVIGDHLYHFRADTAGVPARIYDFENQDISAKIHRGRLAALLDTANNLVPSFETDLNRLAKTFADRVNTTLQAGIDAAGQPGADLFEYGATGEALTISVTGIRPDQIAAADAGAPGGNGNALTLSGLASTAEIDGQSFTRFYGTVTARIGRELSTARESADRYDALANQARAMRAEISAVSLDEEAAYVLQFQRGYQATAQMISVLNELTESVLGILR